MTILIVPLMVLAALFAALYIIELSSTARHIRNATREHRIALAYIARMQSGYPHTFAALFLVGDQAGDHPLLPRFFRLPLGGKPKGTGRGRCLRHPASQSSNSTCSTA